MMAAGKNTVNIAIVGMGFMGRAHSSGWLESARFFDPPVTPVLHTVYGRDLARTQAFADRWGYAHAAVAGEGLTVAGEIDLVDVLTPNDLHLPQAKAALEAGKAVACEKPLAGTLDDARAMAELARRHKAPTFVWYNYRRCPAVALAARLVAEGKLGEITRVRASYLQSWATPDVPLVWRFLKEPSGCGAMGDLNAHIVDMTRFVTGMEITDICGAATGIFIPRRALPDGSGRTGAVTVDDTSIFLARWSNGALGSFEACRQATGNFNRHGFEINGTRGALRFDFERMNELEYYDADAPRATQGWANIMCTHAGDHPYLEAWWPDAHLLGYDHTFTHQAADILRVLAGQQPTVPLPDFQDAYQTQRVLEAALIAADKKTWVAMDDVK
ncbi:MAG: Gfo/Idh/MocA family oxidoreductase [Planctomycetes bacterium]|nr:Gfo/Idh/MocA family oxidoreductase [Planctomycetota bacterium]